MFSQASFFNTIFGRNLIGELPNFVHQPYLVVTMEDLWPIFKHHFDKNIAGPYFVKTLEYDDIVKDMASLPKFNSVIGLGGGQALDVAKIFAWHDRKPLFQVPTSLATNAAFGHRAGMRFGSKVRYITYTVPEAVYIDFDVIQNGPKLLNRSGVCDVFCYHTAIYDWKLAHDRGKTEKQWPYDPGLCAESKAVLDSVVDKLDDIHALNETGIRALAAGLRWGGAAFHNAGWNPRHIEGIDHFLFYTLEYMTHKKFIHGLPVCLGIYIGSALQENEPDKMLRLIQRAGVDIRPEAMDLTWDQVAEGLRKLAWYVNEVGLWYTVASDKPVTEAFISTMRQQIYDAYQDWNK
ncbi:MAG: hypothetical protein AMXMBFR84_18180 [Candidatus Hydrogenedentota bacterium]